MVIVGYFGRVDKEILDEIEVVTAVGYDYKGKNKIESTTVMPVYHPDKSLTNKTLSATGNLSKEALNKKIINLQNHLQTESWN